MSKIGDLTVEVKMSVDRRTAEAALKIVEMYVNENALLVEGKIDTDGSTSFQFIKPGWAEDEKL